MLIALSACSGTQDQPDSQPEPDVSEEPVQPDPPPPSPEELAAAQVEELLSSLTLEEQVGQLFFVRCPADQALEDITTYHLGGYVLFTRDYQDDSGAWLTKDQFVQTLSDYQSAALADTGIPLLIGSDEEGGTVTRASRNPNLFDAKFSLAPEHCRAGRRCRRRLGRRGLGEKQRPAGFGHQRESGPGGGRLHQRPGFHL
ncbi:MAG: glycoside hydrolase family 3 N-terminal domain-containing protein [Dysosmobacter sp.]